MNIQRLEVLSDMMKRAVDRGECAGVQAVCDWFGLELFEKVTEEL